MTEETSGSIDQAWKWCHGKRSSPGGKPTDEGRFHILVGANGRGDANAALIL